MEVALRRVLREAGARVTPNARLRDLGVHGVPRRSRDDRNIEAAAFGLPLFQGVPLLVDVTMGSPLHADGTLSAFSLKWFEVDMTQDPTK